MPNPKIMRKLECLVIWLLALSLHGSAQKAIKLLYDNQRPVSYELRLSEANFRRLADSNGEVKLSLSEWRRLGARHCSIIINGDRASAFYFQALYKSARGDQDDWHLDFAGDIPMYNLFGGQTSLYFVRRKGNRLNDPH
jgi:hypothetical protein